jgi:serine/threonine protein kinase
MCVQYNIEDDPKAQKSITFNNVKPAREHSEGSKKYKFSDTSFWTEGANPLHYERYIIGKRIGQGAYARVKAGIDTQTNKKVAIKIYDKQNLLEQQRRKGVKREIKLLERMVHDHVIRLHEAFDTKKQVFLVMENVSGGSLHSLLKSKVNYQLKDAEAKHLFGQIASAIKYWHSKNITHRDIKLENVLLNDNKNSVKLIDFGFSTWIPNDKKIKIFWGTPSYMAPEIVSKNEFWGPPADVWALGVLLYALLWGKFPFKGKSDSELYGQINSGEYIIPDHVPFGARWLLEKMILVSPEERITASEICKDPWLTSKEQFLKEIYKLNSNLSNSSTLHSKPESRRTTNIDTSPYRDQELNRNSDMPYEAYFPWDVRKQSK